MTTKDDIRARVHEIVADQAMIDTTDVSDASVPADLGVDTTPRLAVVNVAEPPKREGGGKVADVQELVSKLMSEAKVI